MLWFVALILLRCLSHMIHSFSKISSTLYRYLEYIYMMMWLFVRSHLGVFSLRTGLLQYRTLLPSLTTAVYTCVLYSLTCHVHVPYLSSVIEQVMSLEGLAAAAIDFPVWKFLWISQKLELRILKGPGDTTSTATCKITILVLDSLALDSTCMIFRKPLIEVPTWWVYWEEGALRTSLQSVTSLLILVNSELSVVWIANW